MVQPRVQSWVGDSALRRFLRSKGWDVIRWTGFKHPLGKRMRLLRHYGITTVLDVGANEGQYARELRLARYRGRIVSFEPMEEVYARLAAAAKADPSWEAVQLALGNEDENAKMHVSGNSISSSLLPMLPAHEEAAENASYVGFTPITVRRLDEVFDRYVRPDDKTYLKIDVQGYEMHVLEGATGILDRISGLQIELSLVPLYEGGPLYGDVIAWANARGFALMGIEPGFGHPASGRLLQFDGVFYRE
jgi:FkbM family methyltransferase